MVILWRWWRVRHARRLWIAHHPRIHAWRELVKVEVVKPARVIPLNLRVMQSASRKVA